MEGYKDSAQEGHGGSSTTAATCSNGIECGGSARLQEMWDSSASSWSDPSSCGCHTQVVPP